jgi:hypothetical protein
VLVCDCWWSWWDDWWYWRRGKYPRKPHSWLIRQKAVFTAGAGIILGSAVNPGGTVSVGTGDGVGCVLVTLAKILASNFAVARWRERRSGWIPQFAVHPR